MRGSATIDALAAGSTPRVLRSLACVGTFARRKVPVSTVPDRVSIVGGSRCCLFRSGERVTARLAVEIVCVGPRRFALYSFVGTPE